MNILLNSYNFDEPWAKPALETIIKPDSKVLIIPFAFHDENMQGNCDWIRHYGNISGKFYPQIIRPFLNYGLKEDDLTWLDYYLDTAETAKKKIWKSDIIFFTNGLPDKTMDRLDEAGLVQAIQQYTGTIIGCGAGAQIQFQEYHITPDDDYNEYAYYQGFNFIRDFEIELHYSGTMLQDESIRRYKRERGKTLYAMGEEGGIMVEDSEVKLIGSVREV
ncbi:MAG: Type 1 glutamine amidotransferase-like domain-containing protein [Lachnospiraceae bacterium]